MMKFRFILIPDLPDAPSRQDLTSRFADVIKMRRARQLARDMDGDIEENAKQVLWEVFLNDRETARIRIRAERYLERYKSAMGIGHLAKEDAERVLRLNGTFQVATIASEHRADEIAATLHAEMPWMAGATLEVWKALRRCARLGLPAHIPPLLLDGPPGIGKSVWASRLAGLMGVPGETMDGSTENSSFGLIGSQRGWRGAHTGRLLESVFASRVANPVFFLDEADKAGQVRSEQGQTFSLEHALLSLLEPATNGTWLCPALQIRFDLSHVSWVLATNEYKRMGEPLRSRCRVIRLAQPSLIHLIQFAERVGSTRGLSADSVAAVVIALHRAAAKEYRPDLRGVLRMLDRAEDLEAMPVLQ